MKINLVHAPAWIFLIPACQSLCLIPINQISTQTSTYMDTEKQIESLAEVFQAFSDTSRTRKPLRELMLMYPGAFIVRERRTSAAPEIPGIRLSSPYSPTA